MLSPKEADKQEGLFRKIEAYVVTKSHALLIPT